MLFYRHMAFQGHTHGTEACLQSVVIIIIIIIFIIICNENILYVHMWKYSRPVWHAKWTIEWHLNFRLKIGYWSLRNTSKSVVKMVWSSGRSSNSGSSEHEALASSGVPRGEGGSNPPKFRRPSKIVPNNPIMKTAKKLPNLGRQHPKMFGKKTVNSKTS